MAATIKWLRMYTAVPDEAASRAIGDTPYYRMSLYQVEKTSILVFDAIIVR